MYEANQKFWHHHPIPESAEITPNGLDYYSILHGIRCNRKVFGNIRIISIERSGFENRYECFLEHDGIIKCVFDPIIMDKQIEHFLLFSERVADRIIQLML